MGIERFSSNDDESEFTFAVVAQLVERSVETRSAMVQSHPAALI